MEKLGIEDLTDFTEVGRGVYGVVYKCRHQKTDRILAVKKIKNLFDDDMGVPPSTIREISVLKELKHPNIVCLESVLFGEGGMYLVFEYMSMDLSNYIQFCPPDNNIDGRLIKSYMFQLVSGLRFCHARRVLHRDLKPANLLIDHLGNIKIADFGMARVYHVSHHAYTTQVVTLWYRAPELLLGSQIYSTAVDVWSLGIIFAYLINKGPLFRGDSAINQLLKIFRILGTPTEKDWPGISSLPDYGLASFPDWQGNCLQDSLNEIDEQGFDLLQNMLVYDPVKRKSCKSMLYHPYFFHVDRTAKPIGVKPTNVW